MALGKRVELWKREGERWRWNGREVFFQRKGGEAAASVYLCGFSGLLCQGKNGGEVAACV
jgi:nitrite reductase/ring-hydroxylating ferredoxin subunit